MAVALYRFMYVEVQDAKWFYLIVSLAIILGGKEAAILLLRFSLQHVLILQTKDTRTFSFQKHSPTQRASCTQL